MSIEGIYRSPMALIPMESCTTGTLITNVGLEGDRYANRTGTYSVFLSSKLRPGEQEPGRHLTIVSGDCFRKKLILLQQQRRQQQQQQQQQRINNNDNNNMECNNDYLTEEMINVGELLRRNIVVTGITAHQLLNAIGHIIQLGDCCQVLVHRNCVPCMYREKKTGISKLMEHCWYETGISCELIKGGTIHVGDSVQILLDKCSPVDEGKQSIGFFIPPSQRTIHMIQQNLSDKYKLYNELQLIDPIGVQRVEQSYQSVGLQFWPKR